ncbi:hypothetical protein CDAR_575971 [Caerostris darwini]|uniref:Uncharacterized protein n=1 Tax=Caerostris darwini TaxID=1538125 RepID=A0AAV4X6E4_9ARAC|nr:hypothetical protein CDAR_575971 [Caerostris darwini]
MHQKAFRSEKTLKEMELLDLHPSFGDASVYPMQKERFPLLRKPNTLFPIFFPSAAPPCRPIMHPWVNTVLLYIYRYGPNNIIINFGLCLFRETHFETNANGK